MKQSQMFIPTLKEVPADAESASHQLLLRAGFIRQNAAGIYSYLPLGYKVVKKIEAIIREEMERAGAQELLMPAMQPAELWHESGRWDVYGPELMRLKDRHGRDFAMGATGEELITSLVRDTLNTYKKLPVNLYQIQTKYRDEKRPRFGLLRGREFIMKDAYSFHADAESLDEAYQAMYRAYCNIFERCGLHFRAVLADSGAIGGKDTHEFQALAAIGEDTIAYSDASDYAANLEMAAVVDGGEPPSVTDASAEKQKGAGSAPTISVSWWRTRTETVAVLLQAGDEANEAKIKNFLNADLIEMLQEVEDADPLHPVEGVRVLADNALKQETDGTFYSPLEDATYVHLSPARDLPIETFADFRFIKAGDPSPDGKGTICFAKGIEIGQIFKLGTKYSEAMHAYFLDENGKSKPLIMGCYGIGISRTLSAVCEQYHDEKGLIWPKSLAPFTVHLITMNTKQPAQMQLSEQIYQTLQEHGYDVLWDERSERAGVKFAESDLLGCPLQIVVGKRADEGWFEIGLRKDGTRNARPAAAVLQDTQRLLNEAK
ncbi:MAG: proline--tRNA ligase [Sporolactobacillus sp.]